jgi:hypothetical protein
VARPIALIVAEPEGQPIDDKGESLSKRRRDFLERASNRKAAAVNGDAITFYRFLSPNPLFAPLLPDTVTTQTESPKRPNLRQR